MYHEIEAFALALLRADPDHLVPISRLHDALVTETGAVAGGRGLLKERLRQRPDLFTVLEFRDVPWSTESWPEAVRQEYHEALQAIGIASEPRIAPVVASSSRASDSGSESVLRSLHSSLIDLWRVVGDDPEAQAHLATALGEAAAFRAKLRSAPPPRAQSPDPTSKRPPHHSSSRSSTRRVKPAFSAASIT